METALLAAVVVLIVLVGVGFVLIYQRVAGLKDDSALGLIKQDLQGIQSHVDKRLDNAAQAFTALQKELSTMQELGRSLRDIQDVLKSPKHRGNLGEKLMADLIRDQLPKNNYRLQHAFRSGDKVDAVIKTNNGLIPIDSKFPSENFVKLVQTKDEAKKATYLKEFAADVKKHINAISKKYIAPAEGTVDFALMYVPGEAVYYEIMTNTDLCDYGSSQRVYLVSPQSFYYFLQTVLLGLEGELIEAKAKEVMNYLKSIQGDARNFGEDLSLVDKHLTNAKNASDKASSSYAKLSGKIDSANRLTGEVTEKIEEAMPKPVSLVDGEKE